MHRWKAILIAVITVLFYTSPYLLDHLTTAPVAWSPNDPELAVPPVSRFVYKMWILFWPFTSITMLIFYIGHVLRSSRVPKSKKALWGWVLFFGNIMAIPVYWYFYIWNQPESREG